jgi:hypothetical protein
MAEIISFDNRRQKAEDRIQAQARRRKFEAVRRMLRCTHCGSKCLKCGAPIGPENQPARRASALRIPYRFCDPCAEEYVEYVYRLKGRDRSERYWQNDQWLEAWGRWIEYQNSMDQYVRSREFLRLVKELKPTTPEG